MPVYYVPYEMVCRGRFLIRAASVLQAEEAAAALVEKARAGPVDETCTGGSTRKATPEEMKRRRVYRASKVIARRS